jgi:hypothetical protein
MRILLTSLVSLAFGAQTVSAAVVYRIGAQFTSAEQDSLRQLGLGFQEIAWSVSQLQHNLSQDALAAGSLEPTRFEREENMAATALSRDGWVRVFEFASESNTVGRVVLDADETTGYVWKAIDPQQFANNSFGWGEKQPETITLDLGGEFLVREVRFRSLSPGQYLEHFRIGLSNEYRTQGRGSGTGAEIFPWIAEVRENIEPDVTVVFDTPTITRIVQLQVPRVTPKELSVAELEVFGGGYVSPAAYESEVFELPGIASWGDINWSGTLDQEADIDIRTRSGSDPHPEVFWQSRPEQQDSVRFLQGGGDLTLAEYKLQYARLSDVLKPMDLKNWVSLDKEHWSFWSSAYDFHNPGVEIVSPGPNRYFQLRVDLISSVDDRGQLDYIEFKASSPPAVHRLVGEIHPVRAVVGEPTQFTYFVRPTVRTGDTSFDGVAISTPSGVLSVDSLRIAGEYQPLFSSRIDPDRTGFEVMLPRRLEPRDSGALVEVVFTALVLREVGTLFSGRVFDTQRPNEVRQRVAAGDAAVEAEGDRLSVTTSLSDRLLFVPSITPNPFTPNGDGVNDVIHISYQLLRLTATVPVTITVHDLSGREVKRLYEADQTLGEYEQTWDGTDESNQRVPPGLYICSVRAAVQSAVETRLALLGVAY